MISGHHGRDGFALLFLHEEAKVEADRRHLVRFRFSSWPMILFMFAAFVPVCQPSAPHAERTTRVVVRVTLQVVLFALCLGERHRACDSSGSFSRFMMTWRNWGNFLPTDRSSISL